MAFIAPGLLLAAVALMMIEQSGRWLLTSAARDRFVNDEFQIDHLRDEPGKGVLVRWPHRFQWRADPRNATVIVSLDRLRELKAAGVIPGARAPVRYLTTNARWAALDDVIRFRVQAPEDFETEALSWTIVDALAAAGAVWGIRKGVRVATRPAA